MKKYFKIILLLDYWTIWKQTWRQYFLDGPSENVFLLVSQKSRRNATAWDDMEKWINNFSQKLDI